jgi:hypothetical protein
MGLMQSCGRWGSGAAVLTVAGLLVAMDCSRPTNAGQKPRRPHEEAERACWRPLGIPSPSRPLSGTVVATGIPGAGAIAQVGTFHPGGPLRDNPAFAPFTAPGAVLDPTRILVASSSNFGAPLAQSCQETGSILSIDGSATSVAVPPTFAAAGGQASSAGGAVRVYTAQSPAFRNGVHNPEAVTATEPGASLPLSISLNNGFGRPWFANAPAGAAGDGTITVLDPNGVPLAGAPFRVAGGVFSGTRTNRTAGVGHGITAAAVGTAMLTKSPDGTGRAVFVAALADGSVVQVHVGKGVDGLLPPGTFTPLHRISKETVESNDPCVVTRVGVVFNWVPSRFLLLTDPRANRILRVDLTDNGTLFAANVVPMRSADFFLPIDVAPTSPEVANPNFASGSTLGGGSDVYVLNRGDNTILRMRVNGTVVAKRSIRAAVDGFRAGGIGVSTDGQTLWVAGTTLRRGGVVLKLPAFGATGVTEHLVASARAAGAKDVVEMGKHFFSFQFGPEQRLGPLFNERSCVGCHHSPAPGGMGTDASDAVTRVAKVDECQFDPLLGRGGPIARMRSVREFGRFCPLPTGVPAAANATSVRNAMTLRGTARIDAILDADILANQAQQPTSVRGIVSRLPDGRLGRFGWKAHTATLVEFMAEGLRDEMGVTNPLLPRDFASGCDAHDLSPEVDGEVLQALTAFLETLNPPTPTEQCLTSPGAALFDRIGCAGCHTPSLSAAGRRVHLYSDLLLHDMGPGLADRISQAAATGAQWRTTPLWRLSERTRFLHDGRAASPSEAVEAHGGQATSAASAFRNLEPGARSALLEFLNCI